MHLPNFALRRQQNVNNTQKSSRYTLLDTLRGIALVSMILYHGTWDLVYAFGVKLSWFPSNFSHIWQQSICQTFILLSGFCFSLGKHRLKRGLIVFGAGLLVSISTCIFMPQSKILFGVLTLIGASMLIMVPLARPLEKINPYVGTTASLLLFWLTRRITKGIIGFGSLELLRLPKWLYHSYATAFIGFPKTGFRSSDYFPLFPWIFLFIAGFFIYRIFKRHDILRRLPSVSLPLFAFVGKHSLIAYLLHQPIVYGALYVIFNIFR